MSKRLLVPIQNLIEALQRVAEGDFTVRLPENHEDAYAYNMNANFNKMVKELNSMEMLQSDFIQNVSHEFKTPLTSIEGYATLLNGVSLPDELHVYSGHILESARQLSVLTGNILKISKLENQGIVSQKESFSWTNKYARLFSAWRLCGNLKTWTLIWICLKRFTMAMRT